MTKVPKISFAREQEFFGVSFFPQTAENTAMARSQPHSAALTADRTPRG
jgi:hypothetical protein